LFPFLSVSCVTDYQWPASHRSRP